MNTNSLLSTTDARHWAKEFMETFPNCGLDEGTMLAWFANAMCAQHDSDRRPKRLTDDETLEIAARVWCDQDFSKHVMDSDAAIQIAAIIKTVNEAQCVK